MVRFSLTVVAALVLLASVATPAHAASANMAALQVALGALDLYRGPVDGTAGPATRRAIRRLQRRRGLAADGVAGPRTRAALGRRGRPTLGSRVMRVGDRGWDVAALQFLLRQRGCDPGTIDGGFGRATRIAVRECQRRRGLRADGVVGSSTLAAVRRGTRATPPTRLNSSSAAGPVRFLRPLAGPITDRFGPRHGRPHQGIDFPASTGTPVTSAGRGIVRFAGWNSGGYGNLVIITHRLGFESWYAHMASVNVRAGEGVVGRTVLGTVGSTGRSTGPHLHFETRLNGSPFDPLTRLIG